MNQKWILERIYIKLDRIEKRWLRLTIYQFFQFHCHAVCYAMVISLILLLAYTIPLSFLWGIPTLVLGLCGYIILHKKVFPLITNQCYIFLWKFLKLKIVKHYLMLICLFEVTFVVIMLWYCLERLY